MNFILCQEQKALETFKAFAEDKSMPIRMLHLPFLRERQTEGKPHN